MAVRSDQPRRRGLRLQRGELGLHRGVEALVLALALRLIRRKKRS